MQSREIIPRTDNYVLMATGCVSAGEAVEIDTLLERVDLNEFLTGGESGVFFIRAVGDSMEAEIRNNDWLVVNRNLQAQNGDKIVASINGNYTVKIFRETPKLQLVASNGKYAPRPISKKDDFEIFGVITHVLRSVKKI